MEVKEESISRYPSKEALGRRTEGVFAGHHRIPEELENLRNFYAVIYLYTTKVGLFVQSVSNES